MARGGKREGAGRPKGSANKENKQLREMILQALDEQPGGGVEYLKIQAKNEPRAFLGLLGKVLPMQVQAAADDGVLPVRITVGVRDGRKSNTEPPAS